MDGARRARLRRRIGWMAGALAAAAVTLAAPALAWDHETHRLIARLALDALAPSPLKDFLSRNESQLEYFTVEPDRIPGRVEKRRHYVDLEMYGRRPFEALDPSRAAMEREWGRRRFERNGTLPWTVERRAAELGRAWRAGQCASVLKLSGYVAHYVGDASQPLHTTVHYDGYRDNYGDRGMHARLEGAADSDVAALAASARPRVKLIPITSVWSALVEELRSAHQLVGFVVTADRETRAEAPPASRAFKRKLVALEQGMMASQVARAASVLAAIWFYEWEQAGRPAVCASTACSRPPAVCGSMARPVLGRRPA
jgi:hypothetical protein